MIHRGQSPTKTLRVVRRWTIDTLTFAPTHRGTVGTASLDRTDSTNGYVDGNIQWVHKNVNLAKHSLSQDDFIELCSSVASHCGTQKTEASPLDFEEEYW